MTHIEVVAAVIVYKEKILCVQRGVHKYNYISKKYEFPGGKIEIGESQEAALIREIKEELDMEISTLAPLITINHQYPDFQITMYTYLCSCKNNLLKLTEHIDFQWLNKEELQKLDWAAADIPIVDKLIN